MQHFSNNNTANNSNSLEVPFEEFHVASDYEEIIDHGTADFPLALYRTQLSKILLGHTPLHWHTELQFLVVVQGKGVFTVNKIKYHLTENQGLFINSGCLHCVNPDSNSDCTYLSLNIAPNFFAPLDSIIQTKYLQPFFHSQKHSSIVFSSELSWQRHVLDSLQQMFHVLDRKEYGYEIELYSLSQSILSAVIHHSSVQISDASYGNYKEDLHIKDMIQYIEKNYMKKITLEILAREGNVSKSECCRIFKRTIDMTPIEYLITHRINESIKLLRKTDMSIMDISLEVGFGSVSYFIEKFKKQIGYSPKKYQTLITSSNHTRQTN